MRQGADYISDEASVGPHVSARQTLALPNELPSTPPVQVAKKPSGRDRLALAFGEELVLILHQPPAAVPV